QFCGRQFEPGSVDAPAIAEVDEPAGFIEREKGFYAVAQTLRHGARVIAERFCRLAGLPSAKPVLQRLRQVPMIQRRERFDAIVEEFVYQTVVEIEPLGVRRAGA